MLCARARQVRACRVECSSTLQPLPPLSPMAASVPSERNSVPNYKTFQESWRVKTISSLIKIIKRNIKIYDIKLMYYKNITNKESNGI